VSRGLHDHGKESDPEAGSHHEGRKGVARAHSPYGKASAGRR
jgi:hypothetical protein